MRNLFEQHRIFALDAKKLRSKTFFENKLKARSKMMARYKTAIKELSQFGCPLCCGTTGHEYLRHQRYVLVECSTCGLVSPNINFAVLPDNIYNTPNYRLETMQEILRTYEYRKNTFAHERLDYLLTKVTTLKQSNIRLLDVGCGPGYFLSHLKDKNIRARGLEVADFLVEVCRSKGLDVTGADLGNEPNHYYNVITLFDVIEHMRNPLQFCQELNLKLKLGGYILMYTPNIHSVGFYLMGSEQNLLLPYQHLAFFDEKSWNYLAERAGFEIITLEYYGLDVMDYFYMKSYKDKFDYFEPLTKFVPIMQAIIDKANLANHQRIILRKVGQIATTPRSRLPQHESCENLAT